VLKSTSTSTEASRYFENVYQPAPLCGTSIKIDWGSWWAPMLFSLPSISVLPPVTITSQCCGPQVASSNNKGFLYGPATNFHSVLRILAQIKKNNPVSSLNSLWCQTICFLCSSLQFAYCTIYLFFIFYCLFFKRVAWIRWRPPSGNIKISP
jgi:hypothetical protein